MNTKVVIMRFATIMYLYYSRHFDLLYPLIKSVPFTTNSVLCSIVSSKQTLMNHDHFASLLTGAVEK